MIIENMETGDEKAPQLEGYSPKEYKKAEKEYKKVEEAEAETRKIIEEEGIETSKILEKEEAEAEKAAKMKEEALKTVEEEDVEKKMGEILE